MLRLYIIRHGETEYNKRRLMQGHDEVPLNDAGIAQAARLAERMRGEPLDAIYASDLRRAAMTATVLAAATGKPLHWEPLLRERNPGELTGKSYEETIRFFTDADYQPPGGESFEVFDARVGRAVEALLRREAAAAAGGERRHIAAVTHGMVCASFLRGVGGFPPDRMGEIRWANTSITVADYDGGWKIERIADATHLEDNGGEAPIIAGGKFSTGA